MLFKVNSLQGTKEIAKKLKKNLFPFSNILIYGEMGAGKTHFVKFLLEELGVKETVKSPTYSFHNFYEAKEKEIWHYDLYRLESEGLDEISEHFEAEQLVLVEWAERLAEKPSSRVEVKIKKLSEEEREFEISFQGTSLDKEKIKKLIEKYKTPKHVLEHSALVSNIGLKIAKNLEKNGVLVDKKLVQDAGILHDLVRYVDFKGGIQREKIPYPVSDAVFDFWLEFRKKNEGKHHAEVGAEILRQHGLRELAEVVRAHRSSRIFRGFNTLEEKIICYADKRALNDQAVSIKERIEDGKKRYPKDDEEWRKNLEEKVLELERELRVDF